MSSLFVYHVSSPEVPLKVLNHLEDIAPTLAEQGITFERWPVSTAVAAGSSSEQVLAACAAALEPLARERDVSVQQVISLDGSQSAGELLEARRNTLAQAYWFVSGRGLLYVQVGESVYGVLCEKHDLISVPAGAVQWLDAGEHSYLVALRLATSAEQPQAVAGGDDLASRFPRLEF